MSHTFEAQDGLLRAVHPEFVNSDDGSITSGGFQNDTGSVLKDGMSVGAEHLATPEEVLAQFPKWAERGTVVRITVQNCWDLHQKVVHTPTEALEGHSDVVGKKTRATRKRFAENCVQVYP